MVAYHQVYDYVTCRLTAKKSGLAPSPMLIIRYGIRATSALNDGQNNSLGKLILRRWPTTEFSNIFSLVYSCRLFSTNLLSTNLSPNDKHNLRTTINAITFFGQALPQVGQRRTAVHGSGWQCRIGNPNTEVSRLAKFHPGWWRDSGRRSTVRCAPSVVEVHCGRTWYQLPRHRRSRAL